MLIVEECTDLLKFFIGLSSNLNGSKIGLILEKDDDFEIDHKIKANA